MFATKRKRIVGNWNSYSKRRWETPSSCWGRFTLELRHMAFDGKQFVQVEPDAAEDWYLLMRKVDTKHSLINILETGIPKRFDLILYVETLTKRLEQLTLERTSELEEFVERGTAHIQSEIMGVFAWAQTASPQLDREDTKRTEQVLRRSLSEHSYWRGPVSSLSVVVDNNPDNILFLAAGVSFIDTMPPKAEWRVHDRYFALCRTSADISALAGSEQAEVLHETYALKYGLPSDIVRTTYEIAAALIQVPYRKMVGQVDLASHYATFVRRRTAELERLLG